MTSKDALRPFVDWITVFPGRSRTTLNLIFIGQRFSLQISAIGLRQILPRQTKTTFFIIVPLIYRKRECIPPRFILQ